jgi:hypothetical protein
MSTVQINPFRPSPLHPETESYVLRIVKDVVARPPEIFLSPELKPAVSGPDSWPFYTLFEDSDLQLQLYSFSMLYDVNVMSFGWYTRSHASFTLKADSHIACRAHAVSMPLLAAKGLECVFPIWFTQCGRVWFTLAMPCPCHALTMPFFSRPRHCTAVERWPVGYLPAFGFIRLPRGVPRRLLSEAYQFPSQRSIPTTVKSGSSTLQKRRSVKLLD